MELKELIIELCSAPSPSSFETEVFGRVSELLSPLVDEIKTDALGNLIAVKRCGKDGAERLMLDAHMDEIGLIVTGYDKGFLRFSSLGGVDPRLLPASVVKILTQPPICGVIDTMPPHALNKDDMDKSIEADKLYIDAGLSEENAKKIVPLGTPCVFDSGFESLFGSRLSGKALDDKACVAILIKVMQELKDKPLDLDLYVLISTQEEVGLRGAAVAAYGIDPDAAVIVDATHAETPDAKKGETMKLGSGASIAVGPNMSRRMTNALFDTAHRLGVTHQTEVISGESGTNGWVVQTTRDGVATALLSLPVRYLHTPVETMDLSDAEAIVSLLVGYILGKGDAENA